MSAEPVPSLAPHVGTRVYRYGLLPPTAEQERVNEQMRLAHRYRNRLVEIERARREARDRIAPGVEDTKATIAVVVEELEAARATVKQRRMENRTRRVDAAAVSVRDVLRRLKSARQSLKDLRSRLREDEGVQAKLREVDEEHAALAREARAQSGVYWGTYLIVEQAHQAARKGPKPPRFQRYTGDGAVAVEVIKGIAVTETVAGRGSMVRLELAPGAGRRARVKLRIGTLDGEPVWAEWPLIYHRPLPPEARIKWAKIVRERTGTHYRWSLHVTLADVEARERCGTGAVAVNLSWTGDSGRRLVGVACSGPGESDVEALAVPERTLSRLAHSDKLRSIRDTHMDAIRALLVAWRDSHKGDQERLSNVGQWKGAPRFVGLAHAWREHRFRGDEEIYAALEAYRKKDRHLYDWEANDRRKAIAHRRDTYRVFAARLARQHGTLVLEKMDLARMKREPSPLKPVDNYEEQDAGRRQMQRAAPGELRSILVQAFRSRGGRIVEVPPAPTALSMLKEFERSGGEEKLEVARPPRFNKLHRKPGPIERSDVPGKATARNKGRKKRSE